MDSYVQLRPERAGHIEEGVYFEVPTDINIH